ncbi:hypothetical protein [Rhodococcus ruber]|uniref:hypothetical protein n=1 Tax=Rhodococcus ruber TaxID=1830 RepID=UPI003782E6ED
MSTPEPSQWPGPPDTPPGPAPAQRRPTPVDVETAFQLWCAVAVLGLVYLGASVLLMWERRDEFVDQMTAELARQTPPVDMPRESLESLLPLGFGITAVLGLVFTGLFVLVAFAMRRGRNWARMLLTMIGVFLTVTAIPTVFGVGALGGGAGLVIGLVSILQGVCSVGAIVLMHRREPNLYFLRLPPS